MNSTQRKFLVDKIQEKVTARVKELQEQRLSYPSASNYLFKAVLNNELKLQSEEVILEAIKQKALQAKEGSNWLSEEYMGMNKENTIKIAIKSLFVLPEDYYTEYKRVKEFNEKIEAEIKQLKIEKDSIEMRIQLASDKTLQNLINEVDDMGDISLVNTKLKLIN